MDDLRLGAIESRFADIIWDNAPLGSGELVKLAAQELGWKKSTTYTVLRKLCERGFVRNENTVVSACIPKEKVQVYQSGHFVEHVFEGSLPGFLTAFLGGRPVSEQEARELKELIDQHTRKGGGTS